jgi:hypothetical protein
MSPKQHGGRKEKREQFSLNFDVILVAFVSVPAEDELSENAYKEKSMRKREATRTLNS